MEGDGRRHATRAEWFAEVASTLGSSPMSATATVALDAISGEVIARTPAAETLLGSPVRRAADLVEHRVVARPDLDRLRRHLDAWRLVEPPGGDDEQSAHSWSDRVQVHRPDGSSPVLELRAIHHRRPRLPAEVLLVTLVEAGPEAEPRRAPGNHRGDPALWSILDAEGRIVALDPRFDALWSRPDDLVGSLTSVLTHPEDLAEILPVAADVLAGLTDRATYTVRLAADDGTWVPVQVEARRMVTAGTALIVLSNRVVDEVRRLIPAGTLSAREVTVVASLFDGLRIAQIAERDQVSAFTVRNQLASTYRKLDVSGQADLLARYHRPTGT